jgi:hypothetical protein
MTIDQFIELKDNLELQKYARRPDFDKKNCCSFYGSLKSIPMNKTGSF